jgi:ParB family chromosome partitioning protein
MNAIAASDVGSLASMLGLPRPQVFACLIGRELAKGRTKSDIARSLGKSAPWVTQHAALLELPAPIAAVVEAGRTSDVTVINALAKAYQADPERVTSWLRHSDHVISRESVRQLREQADAGQVRQSEGSGRPRKRRPSLVVSHQGKRACLLLNRSPEQSGQAWIRYDQDGRETEVPLSELKIIGLSA